MTRTREEVLREYAQDWHYEFGTIYRVEDMADRIAALEAEVARVSENQQPGEPVAWALYEGDAVLHFTAKQSTRRDWEKDVERPRMVPLSIVPLYAHPRPRVGVTEEIPKSLRDKWHREKGNGMTSAVGEYTPSEFWLLLDAYEAQLSQSVALFEECAFLQEGAERSMKAHADALRQLTAALALADSPAPPANGGGEVARG